MICNLFCQSYRTELQILRSRSVTLVHIICKATYLHLLSFLLQYWPTAWSHSLNVKNKQTKKPQTLRNFIIREIIFHLERSDLQNTVFLYFGDLHFLEFQSHDNTKFKTIKYQLIQITNFICSSYLLFSDLILQHFLCNLAFLTDFAAATVRNVHWV